MIRYILTKILNKYKLYLCLMVGIISIIMISAMIMMFRNGSELKLIQKTFVKQREVKGEFPAYVNRSDVVSYTEVEEAGNQNKLDYIDEKIESYHKSWNKYIQLPELATQKVIYYKNLEVEYSYHGKGHVDIGYMEDSTDGSMSEHYNIISGADLHQDISEYEKNANKIPEDAIPCLVSHYYAEKLDLVVGELIINKKMVYGEEESEIPLVTLYINGIIEEKPDDYFWNKSLSDCESFALVDRKDFEKIFEEFPKDVYYDLYEDFDYRYLNTENTDVVRSVLKQIEKKDEVFIQNITPVIKEAKEGIRSVQQMLYVIVLPLIVLVLIFIGMISFRIIDSESGELSTLRNRGLSKARLILMYVVQSFILAGVSVPIGLLIGFLFGKFVAGVDDFMGFTFGKGTISVRNYYFTQWMVYAGIGGALIAIIVMLIPVFLFFKKKKNKRKSVSAPVWEKYFIDVALMVVSIYLLYNYNKQVGTLSAGVIRGEGIDPIIFINATLFLFACGMMMLRIIFYMVALFYKVGANKFSPVVYSGVLQIMRTRKASAVISIFLVMTVAMSLFNANMARTINANKEARIKYNCGADYRIVEKWNVALQGQPPEPTRWKYTEPDYSIYSDFVKDGAAQSTTKVIISDRAVIKLSSKDSLKMNLIGINTKEFGETATLRDELNEQHWYNYLNALADEPEGVIISENIANKLEISEGKEITVSMTPPKVTGRTDHYASVTLKVVAIVKAWPGYEKYSYEIDEDGKVTERESYLAVMNYTSLTNTFGLLPYEVWAKSDMNPDEFTEKVKESAGEKGRHISNIESWRENLVEEKSSAIMQITNGLFTADFLIALLLCIIGYLIYWITSIRDRELLFGIYRAMGISRKEINGMLIIEQIFLSFMSILAGILAGTLASKLFVKVFAAVYLPQKHNISVFVNSYGMDLVKMGVVLVVVVIWCVLWIRRIVKGLNITEALKLGDD